MTAVSPSVRHHVLQTHQAKRVEITIEAPMRSRLTDALTKAGVTGYTILPVLGGNGRSGPWSREGQVSAVGGMVCVICIVAADRKDRLLDAAFAVLERHAGARPRRPADRCRSVPGPVQRACEQCLARSRIRGGRGRTLLAHAHGFAHVTLEVALFVDDLPAASAAHQAEGREVALYAEMADGFAFAMIDMVATHGHFLELYEPQPALTGFYDMVARKARGWDGADPVRTISFG